MAWIVGLVFVGAFVLIALPMIAIGNEASQQAQKAASTLDSALASDRRATGFDVHDLRKSDALSAIPWLNQLLHRFELAPRLRNLLSQADLKWTAGALLSGCGACFAVPGYLIFLRSDSLPLAMILGLLIGFVPLAWVLFKRNKRFGAFLQGLPEALDLMVSAVRAGNSLVAAMGMVGRECSDPVGAEFKTCFEEQNYGLEMKAAMDNMIARVPLQELRIVTLPLECVSHNRPVLGRYSSRRGGRGGGNVGIAAAISKVCGEGRKTVVSFSGLSIRPSFPRPVSVATTFRRRSRSFPLTSLART